MSPEPISRHSRILLTNGRFVDVERGVYYPHGTRLLIQDGSILALPGEQEDISAEVTLNLEGRAVIPGLFNTHCHLFMNFPSLLMSVKDLQAGRQHAEEIRRKKLADCLEHGVTTIRDALTEDLADNRSVKEQIQRGELRGPRILQAVCVTNTNGAWEKHSPGERLLNIFFGGAYRNQRDPLAGTVVFPKQATPAEVRAAVDRALDERGADCIKIYEQPHYKVTFRPGASAMTQEQLDALADQARKRGVVSTMHHVQAQSLRRAVQAGVTSLAHLPVDEHLRPADVRHFAEAGTIIEPTLTLAYGLCFDRPGHACYARAMTHTLAADREQTIEALAQAFWLEPFQASLVNGIERAAAGKTRIFGVVDLDAAFRYYSGYIPFGVENLAHLWAAGGKVACGNDGGIPPGTPAMVGLELQLLERFLNSQEREGEALHLTPADLLRSATLRSAEALGVAGRFGSLAPGKAADLAILDGDPLGNSALIGGRVAALFLDGELVVNHCGYEFQPV